MGGQDKQHYLYCCNFGCMYPLKHVVQLKEKYKEDIKVYVFYMDICNPGNSDNVLQRHCRCLLEAYHATGQCYLGKYLCVLEGSKGA